MIDEYNPRSYSTFLEKIKFKYITFKTAAIELDC